MDSTPTSPTPATSSSKSIMFTLIGILILGVVTAEGYRRFQNDLWPFGGSLVPIAGPASLLPADSWGYFEVNMNEDSVTANNLKTLSEKFPVLKTWLEDMEQSFNESLVEDEETFTWEDNFKPAIGDHITVSVNDTMTTDEEGQEVWPDLTVLIHIGDKEKFETLRSKAIRELEVEAEDKQEEKVNNTIVTTYTKPDEEQWDTLAWATVSEEYLAISTNPEIVKNMIRGLRESLASNQKWQDAVAEGSPEYLTQMYLDYEAYLDFSREMTRQMSGAESAALSEELYSKLSLDRFETVLTHLTVEPNGFGFDELVNGDFTPTEEPSWISLLQPFASTLTPILPESTFFALNGQDLRTVINMMFAYVEPLVMQSLEEPYASPTTSLKDEIKADTDIEVDQEILAWMNGEYGITVSETGLESIPVALNLLFRVDDPGAVRTTLQNLEAKIEALVETPDYLVEEGLIPVAESPHFEDHLFGTTTGRSLMDDPLTQVGLHYALLDTNLLTFSSSPEGITTLDQAISAESGESGKMVDQDNFNNVMAKLHASDTNGSFYLDLEKLYALIRPYIQMGVTGEDFDAFMNDIDPSLTQLKSFGVTSIADESQIEAKGFLLISE